MATSLTSIDKRSYDGTSGSIGHGDAGEAIVDKLDELVEGHNAMRSGTATVLAAASSVVVAVGEAYDGMPAVATVAEVDGTLLYVQSAVWDGSGNLTITGNAAATADTLVSWMVDGRA